MALSGSTAKVYTSKGAYWVWTEWSATQDIANNRSTVTVITYGGSNSYGYYTGSSNGSHANVYYGGVDHITTAGNNAPWSASTTKRELCRRTEIVPHNADGTMSIASVGRWWYTSLFDLTSSANFTLDTIPRATQPTLSAGSTQMGNAVTINVVGATGTFSHKIYYSFGAIGNTLIASTGGGVTSHAWTLPLNLANQVPSATSGVGTITVETYSGTTLIGTKSVSFTATVPASMIPTVSNSITGNNLLSLNYVRNKSTLNVAVTEGGSYGSWISSRNTTITGASSNSASSFTSTLLSSSGAVTISTTVTDSRGRSASYSRTITVQPYSNPSITSFNYFRCDVGGGENPSGAYLNISGTGAISPVNNANTKLIRLEYRIVGSAPWLLIASNNTTYNPTTSAIIAMDVNASFEVRAYVADYYTAVTQEGSIGTAFVLLDFHASGESMAIGKVAEGNGVLEIKGNVYLKDSSITGSFMSQEIVASTNLNNVTKEGLYFCPLNVTVTTLLNSPTSQAFSLLVERHAGQKQTLTEYPTANAKTYTRNSYGATWGTWTEVGAGGSTNADTVDGYHATQLGTISTVAVRDVYGDVLSRLFKSSYTDESTISGGLAYRIDNVNNSFIRFCNNISSIKTWLGLPSEYITIAKYARGATGTITNATWVAVSFGKTFASIPSVVATGTGNVAGEAYAKVRSVSTTGFEIVVGGTGTSNTFGWIAFI